MQFCINIRKQDRHWPGLSSIQALQLALLTLLTVLLLPAEGAYRALLYTDGVWDYLLLQLAFPAALMALGIVLSSFALTKAAFCRVRPALALAQLVGCAWFSSQLFYNTIGWTVDLIK